MNPTISITKALVELADEVSRNLSFAYQDNIRVSYGEETITESCLLNLKRQLGSLVQIDTFSKSKESKVTGADWEWHFLGAKLVASFRVQAKRVTKNGRISGVLRQSKTSTAPQADLLISDAKKHNMVPLHCFYCAEEHRTKWVSAPTVAGGHVPLLTGCLIADAATVRVANPKSLTEIEHLTVPWHFLFSEKVFQQRASLLEKRFVAPTTTFGVLSETVAIRPGTKLPSMSFKIPNLNNDPDDQPKIGIRSRNQYEIDRNFLKETALERNVSRIMEIDASDRDFFKMRFG
jgi:hypothetical protein